ncbi:MAG: hypothetical protein WAU88_04100 [Candidatus Zixiibacteriota bacterium]
MRAVHPLSVRAGIWSIALAVFATGLISCTYTWRRAYVITDAQEKVTAGGWTFHPRIISLETKDQWRQPNAPEQFVLSFVAVHPRSTSLYDVSLDSFTLVYPPSYQPETVIPNEATFITYPENSPDSVIKRFSVVDPTSHKLIWQKYSAGAGGFLVNLFVHLSPGALSLQTRSGGAIALDTIIPSASDSREIDTTLKTFLVRQEIRVAQPELLDKY